MTETVMPPDMLKMLKPDFVAPVVGYLSHDSCEENGGLFELGAGWVAKLRWSRAQGGVMKAISMEGVRDIWDQVTDFTDDENPASTQDTFPPVMAAVESTSKL